MDIGEGVLSLSGCPFCPRENAEKSLKGRRNHISMFALVFSLIETRLLPCLAGKVSISMYQVERK